MNTAIEPARPQPPQALNLAELARAIQIRNDEDYAAAGEILNAATEVKAKIDGFFQPLKDKARQALNAIDEQHKKAKAPAEEAIEITRRGMGAYLTEKDRKAREEARQKAGAERQAREAEAKRILEERRQETERRSKEAAALEAAGKVAEAAAVVCAPMPEPPPLPPAPAPSKPAEIVKAMPQANGLSSQTVWRYRITNPDLLPREYLTPDTKKLQATATGQKDRASVPGVEFFSERIVKKGRE